jgi:hypothetical protein
MLRTGNFTHITLIIEQKEISIRPNVVYIYIILQNSGKEKPLPGGGAPVTALWKKLFSYI